MSKIIEKYKILLVVVLLTIPLFWKMLQTGMYSTQDFHLFRLYEFNKCITNFQFPCRWSPDAGLGYGEPIFNFYGQFSYLIGEIYYLISGSFINSIKFLFTFSLIGSAISMYFLSKKIWKSNLSAFLSSLIYVYAPYRAVDVWVRGALPEAMSFVLFPLIILSIEEKSVFWFSITSALLILNHNLSFVMFLPVIITWILYRKFWKGFFGLVISSLVSAFYILPVMFESKFVNLISTTQGYFDFHNHFVELRQLLISNYWGYGASVWGDGDGLSLAIGYLQWMLPLTVILILFVKKQLRKQKSFLIMFTLGWLFLFLTHNKSTIIWEMLPFMKYIQFPWRFFGVSLFCFSLGSGILVGLFNQKINYLILTGVTVLLIILNYNFFRPDVWYKVGDSFYLTGQEWNRQRTASIGDFWPNFGHKIPEIPSDGMYINYFPGWNKTPDINGLILSGGAKFNDTPVRIIGNIISLVSLAGIIIWRKKL